MSFSTDIKKELSQINNLANKKEAYYEFLGYFASTNTTKKEKKIKYSTENEYNINRFTKLLRTIGINDFSIDIQGKVFNVEFKQKDLKILNFDEEQLYNLIKSADDTEIKAFARGTFLGSGSINNPENKYHLEMKLTMQDVSKLLVNIMQKYNISIRNTGKSLYIKDGEEISKFLAFIGGNNAVMKFEEIRVQRDMNNKINRLVNCKTANLNKTLNASIKQINAINKLKQTGKFQSLDNSLKEIAELRLEHPDVSTGELGSLLSKPIGKSGVNYRLKKIIELAEL